MAAIPFFRHRLRCALLVLLSLNLILTGIRQVFDLMGYVWSPIAANFLNVIFTIFALFAAAQLRFRFFMVYICWSPFWLAWNTFLICYYLNVGVLNRDDARPLSWGTGGRSWWARHTPGCQRTYNATSATVEIGECKFLQPFYVEILEAAVHVLLTVVILILTIAFLFNFPRKLIGEQYSSLPRRRSTTNRPHVTVEIGPTPPVINSNEVVGAQVSQTNAADTSFARSSDLSSGYLNVSYDASPAARKLNGGPILPNPAPNRPPPPQPLQNYRRNSHKRRSSGGGGGTGSVQRRTREKSRERGQNGQVNDSDQLRHPRSTSADDIPQLPNRSRSNSRSRDRDVSDPSVHLADPIRTSSSRQSQRLSRPVQDIGDLLASEAPTAPATASESTDSKSSSPKEEVSRRQPIIRSYPKREPGSNGQTGGVIDYSMEPRRIGNASSNGIGARQHQHTAPDPFRSMNPVRRSVISFDPKSDGDTLLRFHDHLARSQETILSRASTSTAQPQQPQQRNPLTAPDVVSFDSGLPPSHGGGSDDDPRLSRDSQNLSTSFARQPQQQRQPIGYEPAFMMSYEPASSQDEPIYRPSFLKTGASQSPVKFRYHPENGKPAGQMAPLGMRGNESDYVQPNSLRGDPKFPGVNGNGRTNGFGGNGHAETLSNGSGSEGGSVAGLAVPRISNSSLLV